MIKYLLQYLSRLVRNTHTNVHVGFLLVYYLPRVPFSTEHTDFKGFLRYSSTDLRCRK